VRDNPRRLLDWDQYLVMPRRLALLVSLAAMSFGLIGASSADESDTRLTSERPIRGVVELFTSQGCSSCPAADAILKTYADSRDVIALSYPVDYWDYLGWKDTLANPRFTERQRAYAKTRGDGAIYTPQIVVDGVAHVAGNQRGEIDRVIETNWPKFSGMQVPVRFWMQGSAIIIQAGAAPDGKDLKEATIWFAVVQKRAEVKVGKGENGGRTLSYTNVVRELAPIGMWQGQPLNIRLARTAILHPDTEALAVLIQQGDGGPIIGAAWMGL